MDTSRSSGGAGRGKRIFNAWLIDRSGEAYGAQWTVDGRPGNHRSNSGLILEKNTDHQQLHGNSDWMYHQPLEPYLHLESRKWALTKVQWWERRFPIKASHCLTERGICGYKCFRLHWSVQHSRNQSKQSSHVNISIWVTNILTTDAITLYRRNMCPIKGLEDREIVDEDQVGSYTLL